MQHCEVQYNQCTVLGEPDQHAARQRSASPRLWYPGHSVDLYTIEQNARPQAVNAIVGRWSPRWEGYVRVRHDQISNDLHPRATSAAPGQNTEKCSCAQQQMVGARILQMRTPSAACDDRDVLTKGDATFCGCDADGGTGWYTRIEAGAVDDAALNMLADTLQDI